MNGQEIPRAGCFWGGWHFVPLLRPSRNCLPLIVSFSSPPCGLTGRCRYPCARAANCEANLRFSALHSAPDEGISSRWPLILRHNDLLYPGRVINSV